MCPSSSSVHSLNGDAHLSPAQGRAYLLWNWVKNMCPNARLDPALRLRRFRIAQITEKLAQLRDFAAAINRPSILVHLMPSAACLRLYRHHGLRQYTPRTISKITRLFDS